mgnify:FL=1
MNIPFSAASSPWMGRADLLYFGEDSWVSVSRADLASAHVSASIMFVLARIATVRPPFGRSLFEGVLSRTPGTRRDGNAITVYEHSQYDLEPYSLDSAETVLAEALRGHGASDALVSADAVDELVVRYLSELASDDDASVAPSMVKGPAEVDMRGMREVVGAVQGEREMQQKKRGFLDRLMGRGRRQLQTDQKPESGDTTPSIEVAPQWLSVEAIKMIDVARIVSLTSWQEALVGLPPRVCQLLWTAADDPAVPLDAVYRPAHDPQVLAAFAAVPYEERATEIRPGVRTDHVAVCRRYGRDPVDDHAAARLRAVREAEDAWGAWREELADGALATRGLIDVDGLTRIGRDPFLRQQYALDVKNTVTTERWVASWLDAGGLLKE